MIGLNVELDLMERGAYLADVYTDCRYEITVNIVSALVLDADLITYARFHSNFVGGGNNFTRFRNADMDKALETGRTSQDEGERKAAYLQVAEIVKAEAPIVPIYSGMNGTAFNKDLKGVVANSVQRYYCLL